MKVLAFCWRVVSRVCSCLFGSWKDYKPKTYEAKEAKEYRNKHYHGAIQWALISLVMFFITSYVSQNNLFFDFFAFYAMAVMIYHISKTAGFMTLAVCKDVKEYMDREKTEEPKPVVEPAPAAPTAPVPATTKTKEEPEKTLLEDMIEKKIVTVVPAPEPETVVEPAPAEEAEAPEPVPTPAPEPVTPTPVEEEEPKATKPKATKPKARPNTWRKPRAATTKELEGLAEAFNHKPTK